MLSVNLPIGLQYGTNLTNIIVEENRIIVNPDRGDLKVKIIRIQDIMKTIPSTIPVDTNITNTCSNKNYAQSSFTITGKGSLPPSPFEPLTSRVNQTKLATLDLDEVKETKVERSRIKEKSERKQIVEAQGWVKNKNGEIFLVANPPQNNNYQTQSNSTNCKFGNG